MAVWGFGGCGGFGLWGFGGLGVLGVWGFGVGVWGVWGVWGLWGVWGGLGGSVLLGSQKKSARGVLLAQVFNDPKTLKKPKKQGLGFRVQS